MKNVITAFLLSVAMIGIIYFSINYLNDVSFNLGNLTNDIEEEVRDDRWDVAYQASVELLEKWESYSKKIKLFSNHQEIDNIEIELRKLPQYIKEETKDEALASIEVLKFLLNHISELEKVKFQNIL